MSTAPPPMPEADKSGLAPVNNINLYYALYNEQVILLHVDFVSSVKLDSEVPRLLKSKK